MIDLGGILKKSPVYDNEKTAYYSISCTWWTSFPEDLGNTMKMGGFPAGMEISYKDGTKTAIEDDHPGLPCCPHCGSLLMQAPLESFIEHAKENYKGKKLESFIDAHSQNSKICKKEW